MTINSTTDGLDHVNIYSKGKTELGRFLSNFTYCLVETDDGEFNSVEGYWYWLGTEHPDKDCLRHLHGFQAKKTGKLFKKESPRFEPDFAYKILKAICIKISSRPDMCEQLKELKIPLTHYYEYQGKVVPVTDCAWIIDFLETR